jgi:hypothetical protein
MGQPLTSSWATPSIQFDRHGRNLTDPRPLLQLSRVAVDVIVASVAALYGIAEAEMGRSHR